MLPVLRGARHLPPPEAASGGPRARPTTPPTHGGPGSTNHASPAHLHPVSSTSHAPPVVSGHGACMGLPQCMWHAWQMYEGMGACATNVCVAAHVTPPAPAAPGLPTSTSGWGDVARCSTSRPSLTALVDLHSWLPAVLCLTLGLRAPSSVWLALCVGAVAPPWRPRAWAGGRARASSDHAAPLVPTCGGATSTTGRHHPSIGRIVECTAHPSSRAQGTTSTRSPGRAGRALQRSCAGCRRATPLQPGRCRAAPATHASSRRTGDNQWRWAATHPACTTTTH